MKKFIIFLVVIIPLFFYGCSTNRNDSSKDVSSNITVAEKYILSKEYTIVSNEGQINKYILTKSQLLQSPYDNIWGVQEITPDQYLNKEIIVHGFIVTNHYLDNLENNDRKRTKVYIMMSANKVIGGYSFPDNDSVGGCYSLEGKTLEEITGLNLEQWFKVWKDKYSS